jgi:hypothetical protein
VVAGVLSCIAGGALAQESDDVFILDFEGPDVLSAAPGPFSCGPDPTRDVLSCVAPSCG